MGCGDQEQRRTLQVPHRRLSRLDVSLNVTNGDECAEGAIFLRKMVSAGNKDLTIKRDLLCTRSAKESNSCPIRLLLPLHRATLPSIKSKKSPNGMNASAAHMLPKESDGARQ